MLLLVVALPLAAALYLAWDAWASPFAPTMQPLIAMAGLLMCVPAWWCFQRSGQRPAD